jgi:hypothetical protein
MHASYDITAITGARNAEWHFRCVCRGVQHRRSDLGFGKAQRDCSQLLESVRIIYCGYDENPDGPKIFLDVSVSRRITSVGMTWTSISDAAWLTFKRRRLLPNW